MVVKLASIFFTMILVAASVMMHVPVDERVEQGIAKVDRAKCVGCGVCAGVCPNGVIQLVPEHRRKPVVLCSSKDKGADTRKVCPPAVSAA